MFLLYSVALFSQKLPEEIISFSGARFAENFQERTLVFGLCVWSVFFGRFLPMLFFIMQNCSSESRARKFSSCQVRFSQTFPPFFFSSSLVFFFSWGWPGSLSFLLPACAQAATPSRSAQPSMHSLSLCGHSLFFLSLTLYLSLSLACVALQRVHHPTSTVGLPLECAS